VSIAGGGTQVSLGKSASNFPDACAVQCELDGVPLEAENVRETANIHFHHGKQANHEADTSFPTDDDLQSPCFVSGNGNGSPSGQFDIVSWKGADEGGAQMDRMEFKV